MTDIVEICLFILVSLSYATSKPCDILENMSCQCHSSFNGEFEQLICNNYNRPIDSIIKLNNETSQNMRTFDSFHLTFYDQQLNISAMFINDLANLFPRSSFVPSTIHKQSVKSTIKITLSFTNFRQINFDDYAFYQLFDGKLDVVTVLTLELTSNGQITFSSMALNQLTVDHLIVHSSSFEPYSFEEIFNNTHIGELIIEGKKKKNK
jgi:hypothetical protein